MKIGFSLSKCIQDIAQGLIDVNDVAFIISLTTIREDKQIDHVIDNWILNTVLDQENRAIYRSIVEELIKENKLVQPRIQGMHRHWLPQEGQHWMDMYPTNPPKNQAVKTAWNQYRTVQELSA